MGAAERVSAAEPTPFLSARLERVFNTCFYTRYKTRLSGGAAEPVYQPGRVVGECNALYYREDYFASALHEVAHWCIAGTQRRQQPDFGYWYAPEGRCLNQQRAFELVERKPQALEWYFSRACGYRFQVSADNLELANAGLHDVTAFQHAVLEQALQWQQQGLPARAAVFYKALCCEFGTAVPAAQLHFSLAELIPAPESLPQ
jgi:elongation factor P hydroxylase